MEDIKINNTTYGLVSNFKHDSEMRALFNQLTEATYGFNFEFWHEAGFWGNHYIPYSLMHDGKMVSNVSISKMEFNIDNEKKFGIQIGTVMTHNDYRHRGLNRYLMELVLEEWKDAVDFIYLFANNTVLDFYPKFNFERVAEFQYSKPINATKISSEVKKLNMDEDEDKKLLVRTIYESLPIAKVSMRSNTNLIMFYCLSFMKNSIYYLEELKAVVLADIKDETLYLNDVYCAVPVDLNEVIQLMSDSTIKNVVLGFAPLDESAYIKSQLDPDDTLFVYKDHLDLFKNWSWRFPVMSHA